jgi:hypothetical protein
MMEALYKMQKGKPTENGSFLFKVDILVHAASESLAMEQLLRGLNGGQFSDFRIESGVQLGKKIEEELSETVTLTPIVTDSLEARIRSYIESNKLIRIVVNKGKGVKLDMPCRIINFDPEHELLTLYHVDEKKVYSILLNEVDDFIE